MTASSDDDVLSRGAQAVRALLDRHGIPKHRHSAFVGEFFELSRAAAHQRVSRSTAWTLEELSALAAHFGETLAGVVAPRPANETAGGQQPIAATLCAGEAKVTCRIWLRPGNAASPGDVFAALRTGGDHVVLPLSAVPSAHALHIARLELDQPMPTAGRVAVLDASEKTAATLLGHLRAAGMDAQSFGTATDLVDATTREGFGGYVIDWAAARSKIDGLLSAIRARQNPCTLVLLSDRRRATAADVADLARAVVRYRAQVLEKPVQLPLLLSTLQSGLNS
jgi:hypothetical protein